MVVTIFSGDISTNLEKKNEFHQFSPPAFFENKKSTSLFASSIRNYLKASQTFTDPYMLLQIYIWKNSWTAVSGNLF